LLNGSGQDFGDYFNNIHILWFSTKKQMLEFFDCNCSYGLWPTPVFRSFSTPEELIKEMNFCGISKALVHNADMRFHSPIDGNKNLLKEIKNHKELFPTRAILPTQTDEMPGIEKLLEELRDQNIKALLSFSIEHQFLLDDETFGELFKAMSERHIPLFARDNLIQIRDLLRMHPELTIIALSQGPHILDRYFRPLIERYPNLYIDLSSYLADNGIESFCEKYGPDRLIFGTGFPGNYMGSAMFSIRKQSHQKIWKEYLQKWFYEK
jgi:predicted TIM-barrel fold metal-dependent hydrolase